MYHDGQISHIHSKTCKPRCTRTTVYNCSPSYVWPPEPHIYAHKDFLVFIEPCCKVSRTPALILLWQGITTLPIRHVAFDLFFRYLPYAINRSTCIDSLFPLQLLCSIDTEERAQTIYPSVGTFAIIHKSKTFLESFSFSHEILLVYCTRLTNTKLLVVQRYWILSSASIAKWLKTSEHTLASWVGREGRTDWIQPSDCMYLINQ